MGNNIKKQHENLQHKKILYLAMGTQQKNEKNNVSKDIYAHSIDGLSASSLKGSGAAYRAQGLL
jgi:hypothetical protein